MAFTREQHKFVSVLDTNCIKEKGYSAKEQDWTLVYYPTSTASSTEPKVRRYYYPTSGGYAEVVHWLDAAYAEETMKWSKHAHVCLTSHQMNILVLFVEDEADNPQTAEYIRVFRKAITTVISWHNLNIIPVIYPLDKNGQSRPNARYGDAEERMEDVLGLSGSPQGRQMLQSLPQIGLIHGQSK